MFTIAYNANSKLHLLREKKEIDLFFSWFMNILPSRIEELISSVKTTEGFSDWLGDYSSASLARLGDWYETQLETRPYSPEGVEYMKRIMRFDENRPIDFEPWTLTDETLATSVKVGMYFGEALRHRLPFMDWRPFKVGSGKSKQPNVDYGQPVLEGPKVLHVNPVGICQTLAFAIARGQRSGRHLNEVFEYNAKMREDTRIR